LFAGDQLRAIVERIERVEEEIKELHRRKKGNLPGSKEQRLRRKNRREVIWLRKQDSKERDELETLIEEYWQAIEQASPAGKKACCSPTVLALPARYLSSRDPRQPGGLPFCSHKGG
jgi:uncharacterized protein (UPF0335 family)